MRKDWLFNEGWYEIRLVPEHMATSEERDLALDPVWAALRFEDLSRSRVGWHPVIDRASLLDMARSIALPVVPGLQSDEGWLWALLGEAIGRNQLLVIEHLRHLPTLKGVEKASAPAPVDEPVKPDEKLTWIELELVDAAGEPVPHEPYRLTPKSGPARTGQLNAAGFARVEGLDPVGYTVAFPEIDGREWKKA